MSNLNDLWLAIKTEAAHTQVIPLTAAGLALCSTLEMTNSMGYAAASSMSAAYAMSLTIGDGNKEIGERSAVYMAFTTSLALTLHAIKTPNTLNITAATTMYTLGFLALYMAGQKLDKERKKMANTKLEHSDYYAIDPSAEKAIANIMERNFGVVVATVEKPVCRYLSHPHTNQGKIHNSRKGYPVYQPKVSGNR